MFKKFYAPVVAFTLVAGVFVSVPAHAQDSVTVSGELSVDQCPTGFQVATGISVNVSTHEVSTVCYGPLSEADLLARQQDQDFQAAIQVAQSAAEAESIAWNAAHPGEQKCIQWGPVVHANGVSTSSGGVCANPVAPSTSATESSRTDSAAISAEVRAVLDSAPNPTAVTPISVVTSVDTVPIIATEPPASHPIGIGGWSEVDSNNNVLGTDVCGWDVCGDPNSSFVAAFSARGIHFVYFAPAWPDGNVTGWSSGTTYDPATNTFIFGNCRHTGGAAPWDNSCDTPPPPVGAELPVTGDSRVGSPSDPSMAPADSAPALISLDPEPLTPAPQLPIVAGIVGGESLITLDSRSTEAGDSTVIGAPSASTDARLETIATSASVDTTPTGDPSQVTIASLVKSLRSMPSIVTQQTVKIPAVTGKLLTRSLTAAVCKATSRGITQLKAGTCRIELSLSLGSGIRVSTVKVIKFRKKG